jgi:hypothetical protein
MVEHLYFFFFPFHHTHTMVYTVMRLMDDYWTITPIMIIQQPSEEVQIL